MIIATPPPDISFLQNPIPCRFEETASNFRRFTYKISVDGEESERYEATREANNQSEIDLGVLLSRFFDVQDYLLPDLASPVVQVANNQTHVIKTYLLTAQAEYTTGTPDAKTAQKRVIWGGLSYSEKDTQPAFFSNTNENAYIWLAYPAPKNTTPTAKEYITLANIAGLTTLSNIFLETEFFDSNGENIGGQTQTITNVLTYKTSLLNVSYSKLVAPYITEKVHSYTIKITAQDGFVAKFSKKYKFVVDHDYKPQTTEFLYINSRGGLSTIRLFGEREDTHEATREQTARYISPFASAPTSGKNVQITNENQSFEVATGYSPTWEDFKQFLDFFRADALWEITQNRLIPVEITTKKLPTFSSERTNFPATTIEFKYLVSNFLL